MVVLISKLDVESLRTVPFTETLKSLSANEFPTSTVLEIELEVVEDDDLRLEDGETTPL